MVKTLEIFIDSADEDKKSLDMLLKELEGTLQPLKQRGLISIWHKRDILPGAIKHQEIQKHLQAARIFLLLISRDFINQDFCYSEEMKQLMQRHHAGEIHVIPILLRETSWEYTPFSTLQPLPDNGQFVNSLGNKDKAFSNIAKGVRKIVDKLLSPPSTPLTGSEANQPSGNGLSSTSSHRSTSKSPSSATRRQRRKAAVPTSDQVYDGVMNYYGVIVGVGEYEDTTNYAPMPACVADAKAVAKQLTSNGYDPKHIRLLVDIDTDEDPLIQELTGDNTELSIPTRGNIISALKTKKICLIALCPSTRWFYGKGNMQCYRI